LYELDGLQAAPIDHGAIPEGTEWSAKASEILQARIAEYGEKEIRFNLCALVKNRKEVYTEQLAAMPEGSEEAMLLQDQIKSEDAKMEQYSKENARRRHDALVYRPNSAHKACC
jgi:ubiquitin carboxyl-terminal hydrolase L5